MAPKKYRRVPADDREATPPTPASPPPSFRSRTSSSTSRRLASHASASSGVDATLADTFDDGQPSDDDGENELGDRQHLIRRTEDQPPGHEASLRTDRSRAAIQPFAAPRNATTASLAPHPSANPLSTSASSNDGVFANLNAKPERGEKTEEQPPSYEQAAADATPPYWETTILAPGMISDEVYVDGLPVGSLFSFIWNGVISMSFNLVGFLLTYLLHTTHAAKNGSRAGLGITLVQYGFYMKSSAARKGGSPGPDYQPPSDPNSHDFDPSAMSGTAAAAVAAEATAPSGLSDARGLGASEWLAYMLMIAGWFILIRAMTDFIKARRHEQIMLQSPDRGLPVPLVAEGEAMETVV